MDLDHNRADNLANWNDRVRVHTGPDGYDLDGLTSDPERLTDVVAFDRTYLGDVTGLTLVHPQCHIGTDTLSWAKLGATVTGIDFSPPALTAARDLARRLHIDATFVESELYGVPDVVTEEFDVVYTGVGAVNWLPDIVGWAKVMAYLTKPGGRFYMREGHPVIWALDYERDDDLLVVSEPYFETELPGTWDEPQSYSGSGTLEHTTTHEWNHGLGEVINALILAGFRIDLVEEHRFLEWPALPIMIEEDGRFRMPKHLADRVPLMYSVLATRPA
ncbi:MAG: class I SAM-dependent methyltransferase [Actinomycetia bacterium]|nr:class I SAM-dependent methyltransferase [Actinomycetes bacterium]